MKQKKDVCISHDFRALEEVTKTLIKQGLESSNLIIGIDFTKINERTGKGSFNNRSLHSINGSPNPYEQVCLEHHDSQLELGPMCRTSFAPVIEAAMDIVEKSGGQYHVLVIIASGEVTRSMDTSELSPQEEETIRSIVNARQVTGKAKKIAPRPPPTSYDHEASNLSRIMDSSAMIFKSSNLILGIDFTKSNEWTGKVSFNNRSLHTIGTSPNPYQQVISIIGSTWATFGEENVIPCFGFGDKITNDQEVFSFNDDESSCCGFDEVLGCYRRIVQYVELGGPTSFAPVIEAAIDIVERSCGQFHVLVIIADGQVTRSVNTSDKALSEQEEISIASILYARRTTGKAKKIVPRPPPTFYAPHASTIGEASNLSMSMGDESHRMPLCPICLTYGKDMAFGCGHVKNVLQTCGECGTKILSCPICRQPIVSRLRIIL
ncbi:hypothetical protein FEM48_Zijuj11G0055600 [Ziziphus jujuba var. spinosa]|uniref:RING-type domain-containing protein n=1 Tax=Ziziphus jujuba var. spinosa TaxID=714518 RepID=A0A978UH43_ZIZJJ|nr:hypothetical protein FEM48_Zijuj11G0055600 [Ziziphus jujuba var. spinosa]